MPRISDCSICSENYAASLNHVCSPCIARTWGLIIVGVVGILGLLVATIVVSYLVSADLTGRGVVNRMAQMIPFQSTKSVIVVWQIVTQVMGPHSDSGGARAVVGYLLSSRDVADFIRLPYPPQLLTAFVLGVPI